MSHSTLTAAVHRALTGRELLSHPFYVRWSKGELSRWELCDYAAQYRHVEAALPDLLLTIAGRTPNPDVSGPVLRNLADEAGGTPTHLELFDTFASALGAAPASPSPATAALVAAQTELAATGIAEGLAGLLAYELQSPAVSASKAAGLREHHDLDGDAVAFWDVHATVDAGHADWTLDALVAAGAEPQQVETAARRAADAWWAFLDERQSQAPAAAVC
jgi:pyrroloquinoline-quinone synthase